MSLVPQPALDVIRRRRERYRPVWNAGIITTAFVAAGTAAAAAFLPAAPTPTNVARAYMEARYDRDWPSAWDLVCSQTRAALGGYTRYAAISEYAADYTVMPSDVDIDITDLHGTHGAGMQETTVTVSVTSDERNHKNWQVGGELTVVEEDGEFRVCGESFRAV